MNIWHKSDKTKQWLLFIVLLNYSVLNQPDRKTYSPYQFSEVLIDSTFCIMQKNVNCADVSYIHRYLNTLTSQRLKMFIFLQYLYLTNEQSLFNMCIPKQCLMFTNTSEVSGLFFFFKKNPKHQFLFAIFCSQLWIFPALCSAPSSLSSRLQHIPSAYRYCR